MDVGEIPATMTNEALKDMIINLYLALTQLVSGQALMLVRNGEVNHGLDAWRRLTKYYKPRTIGGARTAYLKIAQPEQCNKVETTVAHIQAWEVQVREYERKY